MPLGSSSWCLIAAAVDGPFHGLVDYLAFKSQMAQFRDMFTRKETGMSGTPKGTSDGRIHLLRNRHVRLENDSIRDFALLGLDSRERWSSKRGNLCFVW
jgi:hypothetical protein